MSDSLFGFTSSFIVPTVVSIAVGTTPITSGSNGRILFDDAGVVGETNGAFWDKTNSSIGFGTTTPLATIHSASTRTASGLIARGNYFNNTLIGSSSNDILSAIDITPTFTVNPALAHTAYWLRLTGSYAPASFSANTNATTIDLNNSFTNTNNAIGLRIRHTYSNVQNGYGILLETVGAFGIVQTSTSSFNYLAGTTIIGATAGSNVNPSTLNVISGANGGIKVGNLNSNSEHLIISHSQGGATTSTIRNTFTAAAAQMIIDVAAQGNLRLWGTGNVTVKSGTDAGFAFDVNGTVRVNGNLTFQTTNWIFDNSNAVIYRGGLSVESIAFNLSRMVFTDNNGFVFNGSSSGATLTASSIVDIQSTTKGFLPPRMTTAQINAIASPAEGLQVYNTTISHMCVYQAGAWEKLSHSPM
jgi:hypothetical protein